MTEKEVDLRQDAGQQADGKTAQEDRMSGHVDQETLNHLMIRRSIEQQRLHTLCFQSFEHRQQYRGCYAFVAAAASGMDHRQRTLARSP